MSRGYGITNLSYEVKHAYFPISAIATYSVIWTIEKFIPAAHLTYVVIRTALTTI